MADTKVTLAQSNALVNAYPHDRAIRLQRDIYQPYNQENIKALQTVIDSAVKETSIEQEFSSIRDEFFDMMRIAWYLYRHVDEWKITRDGRFYLYWTALDNNECFDNQVAIRFPDYAPDAPLLEQAFVFEFPEDHEYWQGGTLSEMMEEDPAGSDILSAMLYRCPQFKHNLLTRAHIINC